LTNLYEIPNLISQLFLEFSWRQQYPDCDWKPTIQNESCTGKVRSGTMQVA